MYPTVTIVCVYVAYANWIMLLGSFFARSGGRTKTSTRELRQVATWSTKSVFGSASEDTYHRVAWMANTAYAGSRPATFRESTKLCSHSCTTHTYGSLSGLPVYYGHVHMSRSISLRRPRLRPDDPGCPSNSSRAERDGVVGGEVLVARPERGAALLVERVRVRVRARVLCRVPECGSGQHS